MEGAFVSLCHLRLADDVAEIRQKLEHCTAFVYH